jgi:hypothetical protein
LYILNLGINLLSSKKLYSKGLIFTGNNKKIAFWHDQDKVLEASIKGGVYILSWVKPNLGDNAFNIIKQQSVFNPAARLNHLTNQEAYKVIPEQLHNKVFQAQEASQPAGYSKLDKYLYLGNESTFIYNKENDPDSDSASTGTNELKRTDLEQY